MAGSKGEKRQAARREAQPIPWKELTQQQRDAAMQACTILGDIAAQELPRSDEDPGSTTAGLKQFLPKIDRERLNHVVLLDAGRGAGKTALLITLLNIWNQRLLRQDVDKGVPEELLNLTKQVVPVGLIDLQPLPPSTNLLLHLVGQFLPVVKALEEQGRGATESQRPGKRAPWHDVETEEPRATRAWQRFLRAAAMGWDGSLPARSARLDPEAYALELEQTERQRLHVRRCFRELVNTLVEAWPQLVSLPETPPPCFVIPIDDADMNPDRVIELLDLLRTLWHPRVAFLLTGDSGLFHTVLQASMAGALRDRRMHPRDNASQVVETSSDRLAGDVYNKVIPEAHRCRIPELSPDARFDVLSRDGALGLLPAMDNRGLRLSSFEQYFNLQPQARELLPGNLRELTDIALFIRVQRRVIESQKAEREPGMLTYSVVGRLIDAAGGATLSSDWGLLAPPWQFEYQFSAQIRPMASPMLSWRDNPGFRSNRLPPRTMASIEDAKVMLEADVGWVHFDPMGPTGLCGNIVWTEIDVAALDSRVLRFPWPLPTWRHPLDYAVFHRLWKLVRGKDGPHTVPSPLGGRTDAQAFMATVIGYIRLRRERAQSSNEGLVLLDQAIQERAMQISKKLPEWQDIVADIKELAGDLSRHVDLAEDVSEVEWWARSRAGLMAAPESGVDNANEFISELRKSFGEDWKRIAAVLRKERRNRLTWANNLENIPDDKVGEIFSSIERLYHGATWRSLVGHGPGEGVDLEKAFAKVPADPPGPLSGCSLAAYLATGRLADVLEHAPFGLLDRWVQRVGPWSGIEGMVTSLVPVLWGDAVTHEVVPDLEELRRKPDMSSLTDLFKSMGESAWGCQVHGEFQNVGPALRVANMRCAWRDDIWREYPLARSLFEFVWDLVADAADDGTIETAHRQRWWNGVGGDPFKHARAMKVFPWPCVEWPAFIDSRTFVAAWNDAVARATAASALAPNDDFVADDLAYWYVRAVNDVALYRRVNIAWRGSMSGDVLANAVAVYIRRDGKPERKGRRWATYDAWCRMLPLLASPESGLTRKSAAAILGALTLPDDARSALRQLRRERAKLVVDAGDDPDEVLRHIDESNTDHPWVTLIEQRK